MKIKGVLVDVMNEKVEVVEIEKSLQSYYNILNCDCIDIVSRKIDGREFDIVCDDEGLLKDPQKISAIDIMCQPMLVGNLFIVKFDGIEDIKSLNDDEINHVLKNCRKIATNKYPKGYKMLTLVEY